jgi:pSer/pThr/pTyr-binding forkhead associated (FHA) protein
MALRNRGSIMNYFQQSCCATGPLRLICGGRGWSFPQPFVVIGRDATADLVLDHPQVSRCHAYLQVIQGRLFCVDLGSRTGIHWPDGRPAPSGWINPGEGLRIGPFEVHPLADGGLGAAPFVGSAGRPNPLEATLPGPEPRLEIEPAPDAGVAGGDPPSSWGLCCVLTLVGTAAGCGIRLQDSSVSRYHGGLLRTATGIWVIDLLGRNGIAVNGMSVRYARLVEGDQLRIGRFVASLRDDPDGGGREDGAGADRTDWTGSPGTGSTSLVTTTHAPWTSSPASLDGPPSLVPALPSFRAGPLSPAPLPGEGLDGPPLSHLLSQVGLMQNQMLNNYNQSMMMAAQMFASICREEMGTARDELERAHEIVEELRALKESLASLPARPAPGPAAPPPGRPDSGPEAVSEPRAAGKPPPARAPDRAAPHPESGTTPRVPREGAPSTDMPQTYQEICLWLCKRAEMMDGEQQDRWKKILNSILGARREK